MEEVVLAEGRKRQKWSQDPRNTFWTNDKTKFGFRMLEKMGWRDGRGLGVNEDGNKEHVKIHKKDDNLGLGAKKSRDEDWIAQQDSFDTLLADLNEVKNERETTEVKQLLATAGECKKIMYHNFLKSKDLSMRTNEDIDCVFGRRRKRSEKEQKCEKEESCDLTVYHGITTIKSAVSLDDYFSTKREFIERTKPTEDPNVDSPQKKKRKTKSSSCTEQGLRICAGSEYFNYDDYSDYNYDDYSDYNYDDYSDYNYDLDCYCDEACLSLWDCCTDIYQLEYCGEFRGSECISGSVRLVGGSTPYEGLVEICIFQSWQPVCESSFSYPEAKVTCNSLGYSASPDSFDDVSNFLEYTNITNVTTYGAVCEGDESRLTECLVDFQFCQENDKQASVNCSPGCTSSCNTQLNDSQYQLCCDTKNHGNVLQVINEDDDTVYLVCPIETPDWC